MRILFVTNLYPPETIGGYEIRCQLVAEQLQLRGHSVHILAGDYNKEKIEVSEPQISRSLPYRTRRKTYSIWQNFLLEQAAKRAVQTAIKLFQPEIIYLWNMWDIPLSAVLALEDSKIPLVYQIDQNWMIEAKDHWLKIWNSNSEFYKNIFRQILKPFMRWLGVASQLEDLRMDEIIFLTKHRLQEHQAKKLPLKRFHIVYTGVPPARTIRQRDDLSRLKLLFVARFLTPAKGIITAVKAVHSLASLDLELDIFGEFHPDYPEYNAEVKDIIEQDSKLHYKGLLSHEELVRIYAQYDVLLFCSNHPEGMPLVIAEAMFAGLPIIGTSVGGAAEMLLPEASITIPIDDSNALALAIKRLHADRNLWQQLSLGAQNLAQSQFSLEKSIDNTEAILEDAVRRANNGRN